MTSASRQRLLLKPLSAAFLLASFGAHAAPGVPDSGTILQQVQPVLPVAPQSNQPGLSVQPKESAKLPATAPFEIKAIRIVGNTAFSTERLHALVADQENTAITLPQLEELAGRITAFYQRNGFPLSRAVIPTQTIADGTVTIQIVEARYGNVRLNNSSQVNDPLLAATLAPLQGGDAIAGDKLDRALLLLSDVPGVVVNAILKPGNEVGTSDLDVATTEGTATYGNVVMDNYGNHYIGRARLGGTINIVNPFHHGDIFSASAVTTGKDMNYGRVSYDTLLTGSGTRVGVAYSFVDYKLGSEIRPLDAHGTAGVASAWIKQPLIRSKNANLFAQLQYDAKDLRDRIDASDTRTDRHLGNWVLSMNGDLRDNLLAGGINIWSLGWTNGRTSFDDDAAEAADAASARTRGDFSKWNLSFSRLQGLTPRNTVYLNFAAQWADANLDSAEKMTVGGPYTVRAYDIGALSADTGYFGSIELRHDLGQYSAGRWYATAFIDSAHVKINRNTWSTSDNTATLSGAGIGLIWEGPNYWRAIASVASRLGDVPSMVAPQTSMRGWLTVTKAF